MYSQIVHLLNMLLSGTLSIVYPLPPQSTMVVCPEFGLGSPGDHLWYRKGIWPLGRSHTHVLIFTTFAGSMHLPAVWTVEQDAAETRGTTWYPC